MELRLLRSFRQLARDLNYSRAAEKLFVAQPALTRQIQQLEADLGVVLFARTKRTVRLTHAGTYLNEQLGPWLDTLDHLAARTRRIHEGELGDLCIGHPGSALYSILPDVLARFAHECPDVVPCLREANEQEVEDALVLQKIDVGFTRELSANPAFVTQLLSEETLALVVPGSHWLTPATFSSMAQCRDEPFVLPVATAGIYYLQQLRSVFTAHGYEPRVSYESNYGATLLRLVEKGLGLAVMPISYQRGTSLDLRFLPLPAVIRLYTIHLRGTANPVVERFIQVCQQVAGNVPG